MKKKKHINAPSFSEVRSITRISDPDIIQRILAIEPDLHDLHKACRNHDSLSLARHEEERPENRKVKMIKDLLECGQDLS